MVRVVAFNHVHAYVESLLSVRRGGLKAPEFDFKPSTRIAFQPLVLNFRYHQNNCPVTETEVRVTDSSDKEVMTQEVTSLK